LPPLGKSENAEIRCKTKTPKLVMMDDVEVIYGKDDYADNFVETVYA